MYSNDRNAPRTKKSAFTVHVISKDLLSKIKTKMDYTQFLKLWADITETLQNETVYNPLGTKLSNYMGELKLQLIPYILKARDIKASIEVGETVEFVNLTSRGKIGKVKWERRAAVSFNNILQFYAFEPARALVKKAKDYCKNHPERIRTARNTLGGHSLWRQIKSYVK